MDSKLSSIHIKAFNEKIKVLNQTNSKDLVLTAVDARNLHASIFELLAQISDLTKIQEEKEAIVQVEMDGGGF